MIFSSKEKLLLALVTAAEMLNWIDAHAFTVTIVFPSKCWGTSVRYESCGPRVQGWQIGSVNELKELADVWLQMGVNPINEIRV